MLNSPIHACILSLASNYLPDFYLGQVIGLLQQRLTLVTYAASQIIISHDKNTHLSIAPIIYHNQVLICHLQAPITLEHLITHTKTIETILHRQQFKKPLISMDIDILAVATLAKEQITTGILLQPLCQDKHDWYKFPQRFPLAIYEIAALSELATIDKLSPTLLSALICS